MTGYHQASWCFSNHCSFPAITLNPQSLCSSQCFPSPGSQPITHEGGTVSSGIKLPKYIDPFQELLAPPTTTWRPHRQRPVDDPTSYSPFESASCVPAVISQMQRWRPVRRASVGAVWTCACQEWGEQVQGETESHVVITEASANLQCQEGRMALQRCPESRPGAGPLLLDTGFPQKGMKPWVRQLPQGEGHSWGEKQL